MKALNSLTPFLLLGFFLTSCIAQDSMELDFLLGTWKMENKDTYEVWKKEANTFKGQAYKMVNGQKQITETLVIEFRGEDVIYSPTVPDQNDGRAIPFKLNKANKDLLSFENKDHDFPKKIQYKKVSDDKIFVSVLGEGNQGFSYYLMRQ
ncbi:MAG: hypothetical protein HKN68_19370 [Saprospiraceae bacterium]|nr:hypothetical protein [Saprospiraceae bacterium]